jgi:hydrogenase-4 component H
MPLHSIVYLLPKLCRTLLTQPITVRYPFALLNLSPYVRERIEIDPDLCQGCGACVRDCPAQGLVLERLARGAFRLVLYLDRCATCGQCETSCRAGAIRQVNAFAPPVTVRADLVQVLVEKPPGE